jgi:hypothetical protein
MAHVYGDGSYINRVLKNSDTGCSKSSQMRGAREIDPSTDSGQAQRRRTRSYVEARRLSATVITPATGRLWQVAFFNSL